MIRNRVRSAAKAETSKTHSTLASWFFISCTFLLLTSLISMWSHWFEICASFGFYQAAGALLSITGAALIISWWVNTDNA